MSTVIDSSDSDVTILAQRLRDCFSLIQDHHSTRTLLNQLSNSLTIAVLSGIAGGNRWEDINFSDRLSETYCDITYSLPEKRT